MTCDFPVRLEVGNHAFPPGDGETPGELVRERDGERHELRRLAAGEANHHALVACSEVQLFARAVLPTLFQRGVHACLDVRRLLVDADDDLARLVVDADLLVVVADAPDRVADDGLVVDLGRSGYLADHDNDVRARRSLTGDAGHRVLCVDRVEYGVRHLVAQLVRVSLGN